MNSKLRRLAERRRQLVARAAAQRTELALAMEPWRPRLALADRGLSVLRYIRRHPVLLMGVTVIVAALRPRRFGKWLERGLVVWQIGRRLL